LRISANVSILLIIGNSRRNMVFGCSAYEPNNICYMNDKLP